MTTLSLIISTESEDGIPDSADMDKFFTDPLGIGLPLVALVAMAGFVLLDIGYDLSNASVKTYMLSVSHQADHVSLLVMGVLMSALGGCSTAATGLVDLTPILGVTSTTSAVCGQAVVQLLTIMVLTLLCTFSSLVSAPSDAPNKEDEVKLLPEPTDEGGEVGVVVDMSTATLQTEVQESIIMATTSPVDALGLSVSTQVERNRDFHSLSIRLGHPLHTTPETQVKNRLLNKKVSYNTMQCLEPETQRKTKMRWNLFIICLAAFFTGGFLLESLKFSTV
nr:hypothetical protein BaRGS_010932 [Batillaria attramentaria]